MFTGVLSLCLLCVFLLVLSSGLPVVLVLFSCALFLDLCLDYSLKSTWVLYVVPECFVTSSDHPRSGWVCFFIRFVGMCQCAMDALQWIGAVRKRVKWYFRLWTHIWVKNVLMLDLFQLLLSSDVNWRLWLIVMFYQTLILTARIHCRASIAETHFYKPDEETNSSWC